MFEENLSKKNSSKIRKNGIQTDDRNLYDLSKPLRFIMDEAGPTSVIINN